jgi:hypothetical protein
MSDGATTGRLLREKHDKQNQKHKRKIKQLKAEKMALEMSVVREKERIRREAGAVVEAMRETERQLNGTLERMSTLTARELMALDELMERTGFWGRLRAGLRLAFTGRLV